MVVVFSCGRTGTNIVLELISGSNELVPTLSPEDRYLFIREDNKFVYPEDYLTKSDSIYCPSYGHFGNFMKNNPTAKIIWTIRHPFDIAMSKIRRGFPGASDASLKGCVKDMCWMTYLYFEATCEFPDRILLVRMEDVLLDIEKEAQKICNFLDIPFEEEMTRPWERMRHPGKRERYPGKLYMDQIDMYLNWRTSYDGFLVNNIDFNMLDLFKKIESLVYKFGYTIKKFPE
jgi:hypothetical protein